MLAGWAVFLVVILFLLWLLNFFSLPGNWPMVLVAAVYWYLMPPESPRSFHWMVLIALVALAGIGELVEFALGGYFAKRAGGSRRGAVLALVGSLIGALVGVFVGLPIPLIGSLISALLFASAGALVGAIVGEQWKGRTMDDSIEIGKAAFWGRMLGTIGKLLFGLIMIVTAAVAVIV